MPSFDTNQPPSPQHCSSSSSNTEHFPPTFDQSFVLPRQHPTITPALQVFCTVRSLPISRPATYLVRGFDQPTFLPRRSPVTLSALPHRFVLPGPQLKRNLFTIPVIQPRRTIHWFFIFSEKPLCTVPWFIQDQDDPFTWVLTTYYPPAPLHLGSPNISNSSHHLWTAFPCWRRVRTRLFQLQRLIEQRLSRGGIGSVA